MDYCYTCSRILNGALVCPGCGAYAPGIDPHPQPGAGFEGPQFDGTHGRAYYSGLDQPGGGHPEFIPAELPPLASAPMALADDEEAGPQDEGGSVLGPAALAPTLHRGRAARRRQMARWKKSRRRAGAAAAVALFGGGLSFAALNSQSAKGPATASADSDNVTSVDLESGTQQVSTPGQHNAAPTGSTTHHATSTQHGTSSLPVAHPTQTSTDSVNTIPVAFTRPATSQSTQTTASTPAPVTTQAPTSGDTSGGGSTASSGSGSTTDTGSGSTTSPSTPPSTPPDSTAPSTPPPHGQQLCLLIICLG